MRPDRRTDGRTVGQSDSRTVGLSVCLSICLAACAPVTPAATLPPPQVATVAPAAPTPSQTPGPTATATALPTPTATATAQTCQAETCVLAPEHLWFVRPMPGDAPARVADGTYLFGSTQAGLRQPHYGVDFFNPQGTPVLAAGAGTVVVAGPDDQSAIGPQAGFYGNVIVIEHEPYRGQRVFTLYGHLNAIVVAVGQSVAAGDLLGEVGQTGIAIGPHLHFEVRVGRNDYASAVNPELWLQPFASLGRSWGIVAGRVVTADGERLQGATVVLRPLQVVDAVADRYLATYDNDNRGDPVLDENFVVGDLPPGRYRIGVNARSSVTRDIDLAPGQLVFVNFIVEEPPPTETFTPTPEESPTPSETPTP